MLVVGRGKRKHVTTTTEGSTHTSLSIALAYPFVAAYKRWLYSSLVVVVARLFLPLSVFTP